MTLVAAWIRSIGDVQELVMASDSRLSGGRSWDCCPKIMPLPRQDSAIAFAGETNDAYPMMLQVNNAIQMHPPSLNRSLGIEDMRGHLVRVLNEMQRHIKDLPVGVKERPAPEAVLLLGGFSVKRMSFQISTLHYDPNILRFTFRPAGTWGDRASKKVIAWAGCQKEEATARLRRLLRERNKLPTGGFDMEPFEVLRDMIQEGNFRTIGGPPQMIKVYRHCNLTPYAVRWKIGDEVRICVHGRALLDYEAVHYPILDPMSLDVFHTYQKGLPSRSDYSQ